jgi:hypothetical protein
MSEQQFILHPFLGLVLSSHFFFAILRLLQLYYPRYILDPIPYAFT